MSGILGHIHSVETFGALDGPGIRYVLFLQGCPLRCLYCHNPDTWEGGESNFLLSPQEALEDILRYRHFIANGGLTLSGGEPLLQHAFCAALIALCHEHGLHCAVDTSGGIPLEECRDAVDAADLLLLDIKALDPELCKALTGRDNHNALSLLSHCEKTGKPVWIRHVLVPGYTLDTELLAGLADFLQGFSCVRRVELLPFHKMGEYKWEALRLVPPLRDTPEPDREEVEAAKALFRARGLRV